MNYAVVILAAIFLMAGIYWLISGRKFYVGPISETQVIDGLPAEKHGKTSENGSDGFSH